MTPYWSKTGHELYLADCREVLPTLGPVDHVITDPPYSEHVHAKLGAEGRADGMRRRERLDFQHLGQEDVNLLAGEFARVAGRWIVCFGDERTMSFWLRSGLPWVRAGVWVKPDAMPQMSGDRPANGIDMVAVMHAPRAKGSGRMWWNGGGRTAVWTHNVVNPRGREDKDHPTPKPLPLMLELVSLFTDEGETVLDPFAGSGTTGVACIRLGRRFIGVEREEKYAEIAAQRLEAELSGLSLRDYRAGQLPMFESKP